MYVHFSRLSKCDDGGNNKINTNSFLLCVIILHSIFYQTIFSDNFKSYAQTNIDNVEVVANVHMSEAHLLTFP
jgi:hypothetical protein